MAAAKKRLTLDLDPPVQRRLKVAAALRGISMRQYCLTAIGKELAIDEANGMLGLPADRSDSGRFAELRAKYFGGEVLPGSGVDFIREGRESRNIP